MQYGRCDIQKKSCNFANRNRKALKLKSDIMSKKIEIQNSKSIQEKYPIETEYNMHYQQLVDEIDKILKVARGNVASATNIILVKTYWEIGRYIVEYEQKGSAKAVYGDELINRLSADLRLRYGKGFSRSNLFTIRQFYVRFPKVQTLSGLLSWSHYIELLKIDDNLEMEFYLKECEKARWSVRELKRQRDSMLFHRLAIGKNKDEILQLAYQGQEIAKPEDVLHDPYVLEFTGLPSIPIPKEDDVEKALITNLEIFLLELGKGFAFVGRQYRISIGGRHLYVDLVFYHRILKCFVLIDLKRGEIQHEDIGQMNLYLNYFKAEENTEGDNEPIGIVLGSSKNKLMMEYALQGITNQLFAARYQLYLPKREELQAQLDRILEAEQK